jgi:hypothetical protein
LDQSRTGARAQNKINRIGEPLILEAKRQHFDQMAQIVSILLSNNLHKVHPQSTSPNIKKEDSPQRDKYLVGIGEGSYRILDE